jgi:hypothetical protein
MSNLLDVDNALGGVPVGTAMIHSPYCVGVAWYGDDVE